MDTKSGKPTAGKAPGCRSQPAIWRNLSMSRAKSAQAGFTLVELLAVVLVLSVLAAIAVPAYVNTRKSSAARACTANLASIAAAESAYHTRFGKYGGGSTQSDTSWSTAYVAGSPGVAPTGGLVGAPEGLASAPKCPLDNGNYEVYVDNGNCRIQCAGAAQHATDVNAPATTWQLALAKGGVDQSNPF